MTDLPSRTPPVNGTKGDARHTITGKIVDDLKAIFDQPLTADEVWLVRTEQTSTKVE